MLIISQLSFFVKTNKDSTEVSQIQVGWGDAKTLQSSDQKDRPVGTIVYYFARIQYSLSKCLPRVVCCI